MDAAKPDDKRPDTFTGELLQELFASINDTSGARLAPEALIAEIDDLVKTARDTTLTGPIIALFARLKEVKRNLGLGPEAFGKRPLSCWLKSTGHWTSMQSAWAVG